MKASGLPSITKGPRQSNFELLRIIAMAMVLGLHLNFKYSGIPIGAEVHSYYQIILQSLFESICLPAVNIFILISGWFSIRATFYSLSSYLFQCFFFLILSYLGYLIFINCEITLDGLASCLALTKYGWFIISYLLLFILSPIINISLNNISKRNLERCLIILFIISTLYGWIGGNSNYNNGYSIISFIGLYILGRYLSLYCRTFKFSWSVILLISTLLNSLFIISDLIFFKSIGISKLLSYVNPLIITQAVALVMIFNKFSITPNSYINFIAKSSFAVYLLHDCSQYQELILSRIIFMIKDRAYGGDYVLLICGLGLAIYALAICFDQIRISLWQLLEKRLRKDNSKAPIY